MSSAKKTVLGSKWHFNGFDIWKFGEKPAGDTKGKTIREWFYELTREEELEAKESYLRICEILKDRPITLKFFQEWHLPELEKRNLL